MKWLSETLSEIQKQLVEALGQLKRKETWLIIGIIAGFALLTYAVAQFAFRTDSVLRYLRISGGVCRELTNGPIIFLFCGMIFFFLAAVVTFGELQSYFDNRRRKAEHQARQSLKYVIFWGGVAVLIPISALLFFKAYCS